MRLNFMTLLASILACLGCVELACLGLNSLGPERSTWQRGYRFDPGQDPETRQHAASPYRLRARLSELPAVNPNPEIPTDDYARLDLSRMHPNDFWGGPWKLAPSHRSHHLITHATEGPVYDIWAETDRFGRRISARSAAAPKRRHAMLFGCSFAFGNGIRDEETLASQLARHAPGLSAYNYGVPGSGPTEFVEQVAMRDLRSEVPEPEGVAIYLFIPDHVRRVPPSIHALEHRRETPYWYEAAGGEVVRAGSFSAARPLAGLLYDLLSLSQTLKYMNVDFPTVFGPAEFRRAAVLTRKMAQEYQRQFPRGEFVVVLHPLGNAIARAFTRYLDELELKYLDYSDVQLGKLTKKSVHVSKYDWHPSGEANRLLGRQIVRDLGL
ncbi:MAG TPA: hypothetical protein VM598_10740 [Bdellovibrionota bacterium]|nr:hypothetical protein [Bdellovibrionota bacterium]